MSRICKLRRSVVFVGTVVTISDAIGEPAVVADGSKMVLIFCFFVLFFYRILDHCVTGLCRQVCGDATPRGGAGAGAVGVVWQDLSLGLLVGEGARMDIFSRNSAGGRTWSNAVCWNDIRSGSWIGAVCGSGAESKLAVVLPLVKLSLGKTLDAVFGTECALREELGAKLGAKLSLSNALGAALSEELLLSDALGAALGLCWENHLAQHSGPSFC